MYAAEDVGEPIPKPTTRHALHDTMLSHREFSAPADEAKMRALRAQYFGMVSEVDDQLGRLWQTLRDIDQWNNTFIVVTADHGEQLGDQGLINKGGFFAPSYFIVGIVRDPSRPTTHGTTISTYTENIDIFPTLCEAMGLPTPTQVDGRALQPLLDGTVPGDWRDAAHWEFDWSDWSILQDLGVSGRELETHNLAVLVDEQSAYVQFGDGSWRCFDVGLDPSWRTEVGDATRVLACAQKMLIWRARHTNRQLSGLLISASGPRGRWPA
jgi:arylsulfatase A-like enzyme